MNRGFGVVVLAGLSVGLAGFDQVAAAQEVVFSHEVVQDSSKVGLGFYSSTEPRPNKNFLHADDFTLNSAASIGSAVWWGQSNNDFVDGLDNFNSFELRVYASRVTLGGQVVPKINPIETRLFNLGEFTAQATGRVATHGGIEHRFTAAFTDAIQLDAGVTYFLSIGAGMVDPAKDVFQWSDSELDNGWSGSWSYERTRWEMLQDTDSAFKLISVPGPGSLAFLSLGPLFLTKRRR